MPHATQFLDAARQHMDDRATTYDKPAGERSMSATVEAFNTIAGHQLTEEQGWLFMEILKLVRSQQGDYRADNYEDAVAYAALRGEAAEAERAAGDVPEKKITKQEFIEKVSKFCLDDQGYNCNHGERQKRKQYVIDLLTPLGLSAAAQVPAWKRADFLTKLDSYDGE